MKTIAKATFPYAKLQQQDLFTGQVDRVQVRPSLGETAWLKKAPGFVVQERKRIAKPLTDHQFLVRYCRVGHGCGKGGCKGWGHKDWLKEAA